jgi:NOL1/NOP2/sun family putative RNA methylase
MHWPQGYEEQFRAAFGACAWQRLVAHAQEPPWRGARVVRAPAATWEPAVWLGLRERIAWSSDAYLIDADSELGADPLHAAGAYYLQEPSAMAPVSALAPKPGERVLDMCAAPGGKTVQIALQMQQRGVLVANDSERTRVQTLLQNIERCGIRNCIVTNLSPTALARAWPEYFDAILVDAPCSGEGMFAREPEAARLWSPLRVEQFARLQVEILAAAVSMLRPGGRLVYATCTHNLLENEGVCLQLLQSCARQALALRLVELDVAGGIPGEAANATTRWLNAFHPDFAPMADACKASICDTRLTRRYGPSWCVGEGQFVARFEDAQPRQPAAAARQVPPPVPTGRRRSAAGGHSLGGWFASFAADLLQPCFQVRLLDGQVLHTWRDQLYVVDPEALAAWTRLLGQPSRPNSAQAHGAPGLLRPGLPVSRVEHRVSEPTHALAMTLSPSAVTRAVRLPYGDARALSWLQGAPIADAGPDGWVPVFVADLPLGFGKRVSGIVKNHYPKGLRRTSRYTLRLDRPPAGE